MAIATSAPARPLVLADLLRGAPARDVVLVVGVVPVMALCSQVSVPVPGSPVPVTLQTLGLVVTAAALGPARGVAGQVLFLTLGAIGLPLFSEFSGGADHILGATGGYLVGFVPAAYLIGLAARHGIDRRPLPALALFAAGQVVVFTFGVPWLAAVAELSAGEALRAGLYPFILGGILKAAVAGGLLPAAWRAVRRFGAEGSEW